MSSVASQQSSTTPLSVEVLQQRATAPVFCRAPLNYQGENRDSQQALTVEIKNARVNSPGRWQDCGFELVQHASAVEDWQDEQISRVHYPEIIALAKQMTGCDHALLSSHILRNPEKAQLHGDLAPIQAVHSDFADSYGDLVRGRYQRDEPAMRQSLEAAGLTVEQVVNAKRLVILQFWRNLGPQTMDLPLAFCDARTVDTALLRPFIVEDYAGGGINFETLGIAAPARDDLHQWYAYPDMRRDEVVAFRTFDTDLIGTDKPYWTPHSAFADPMVAPGSPSRASIELRATCLFL